MPIKTVEIRVRSRTQRVEVGGGLPGSPGTPGADGTDGQDGVSVTGGSINGSGHLILTLSSGGPIDVGYVVGPQGDQGIQGLPGNDGVDGTDGTDGVDGISITNAVVNGSGNLIITLSNGGTIDAGDVIGPVGPDGDPGTDGVSITGATVDGSYNLILSLSNGGTINAGYVRGPAGAGTGDVVGPASSVSGRFATFGNTTGKLIADSGYSFSSFATAAQGTTADNAVVGAGTVTSGNPVVFSGTNGRGIAQVTFAAFKTSLALVKGDVGLGNVDNTSDANKPVSTATQTALNLKANLASPALTGTPTAPTAAANTNTTQIATTAMVQSALAAYIAAQDVLVFKGAIDCSTNPNYPAADAGHVYKVSVAGKIGGASGPNVEVGDVLTCTVDGSAAGTQASVGANWIISQVNIDGAVTGPTSSVTNRIVTFNGTTGKLVQDSGKVLPTGDVVGTTDTQTLSGKTFTAPVINDGYTEETVTANTGTAYTIDLANGSVQILTLTGNCTFTFPTATAGRSFTMLLKQDATGSRTATWPSSVKWPGSVAPVITATASKADLLAFTADGTNWISRRAGSVYL